MKNIKETLKNSKKRILIANRGEIAIRIAQAARELGHVAIGVWTSSEAQAAHLGYCDEWVKLDGNSNKETFLNIQKIVQLAIDHKVDAIHPGYGFLSENAYFCEAIESKGLIFIGPNSKAIKLMGDKAISKEMAKNAGVPVVPGSTGEVQNIDEAIKFANQIGYPVLLKAVAGGGGRGMRKCLNEKEVQHNFESVGREAKSAFGNAGLLVEKFIVNPRHIEVQILADRKGNIFHLFERECSVQRRHQKIIEESPSPFIGENQKLRNEICETAVKLAQACKYDSAGTVEFIMGEDKKFYFLEMNTRIQVEHPVTEEVVGVDLVANMIKVAFGEELDFHNQNEIVQKGHSIECRICAEDPTTMLPAPGYVSGLAMTFPQGVRFDHCLYEGLTVTPDFDPMVGKLIVKGYSRAVALRKMKDALNGLIIEGLMTNIPLHKIILEEEDFILGKYSTEFIYKNKPQDKIIQKVDVNKAMEHIALVEAIHLGF